MDFNRVLRMLKESKKQTPYEDGYECGFGGLDLKEIPKNLSKDEQEEWTEGWFAGRDDLGSKIKKK